ncbi:DNA-binding transcriptional LysR family regulator [Kineosphaera limosa]|uniref:Putative LysR family transcriptional regulator n=1 Tax=Kineosphaera limosa NBRC 100340 TaxID=1184609 RepID=K6XBP6_9MICO|nr:LysR family transcriptional regulator [Kineosphaera limosa]NYE03227.1 DNA-binding transcriptional LysR family regulator [Kineosphaera limosa]GAB96249.1 putative LysR family transcriptional regulator [Kineosphaera limosa NBRC 100340]
MHVSELRDLLPDLPVLVEFARTGSVTGAADELGIPQPSASRAMARLAQRTGVPLTQRAGRGLELTPAGDALAGAASEALAILGDGLVAARRSAAAGDAVIAIAYQTVLGEGYLPSAIARFRARHPAVRFRLVHGARARCIELIAAGDVDLALLADAPQLEGMRQVTLFDEPIVLVAHRQHPLARSGEPITPDAIDPSEVIMMAQGFGMHDSVRRILAMEGPLPPEVICVDDARIARGLAAAGAGVTILPASRGRLDDGTVELPIEHPDATRSIGAIVARSSSDVVDDFLLTLRSSAGYRWHRTRPLPTSADSLIIGRSSES